MAKLELEVAARRQVSADRLVVGLFAGEVPGKRDFDARTRAAMARLLARPGWKGAAGQIAEGELARGRTLSVLGLGTAKEFDAIKLRSFVERAVELARVAREKRVAIAPPDHDAARGELAAARLARQALLANYRFDRYRSDRQSPRLTSVVLVPPSGQTAAYRAGVEVGSAVVRGVIVARELANTPPNEATPAWMATRARALAKRWRARVQVLGPAQLRRRKMHGILAVGGGSANPPRLVRVEVGRGPLTVALVGKGVTFDTGGISIKPADRMDDMKWDKCGACAVLGIVDAVVALGLPIRLRAYLPLAENMPSGTAYRPGDIVRCANGKTVEIVNTDAEGRMVLADALTWAASERPDYLVEYSTLTGACVVALGHTGAGLFTPSDELASDLLDAAAAAGERLWRLPLWSEFLDEMRGAHADLKNSGGRWGGASTAAAFLSQFVGSSERWAHLDIAGPAYASEGKEKRGATGFGVALTVGWLRGLVAANRR